MEEIQEKLELFTDRNKIFVIYNSKNENKVGYFKTELIKPTQQNFSMINIGHLQYFRQHLY